MRLSENRGVLYINIPTDKEEFFINVCIPHHALPKGNYSIRLEANVQEPGQSSRHLDFVNHTLSFEVKYIHLLAQDEYYRWDPTWGLRYHEGNEIEVVVD